MSPCHFLLNESQFSSVLSCFSYFFKPIAAGMTRTGVISNNSGHKAVMYSDKIELKKTPFLIGRPSDVLAGSNQRRRSCIHQFLHSSILHSRPAFVILISLKCLEQRQAPQIRGCVTERGPSILHQLGMLLESVMQCDGICDSVGGKVMAAKAVWLDYNLSWQTQPSQTTLLLISEAGTAFVYSLAAIDNIICSIKYLYTSQNACSNFPSLWTWSSI